MARAVHTAAVQLQRMVSQGAKQLGPALFRATDAAGAVAKTIRPAAEKIAGSVLELAGLTAEITAILQAIDRATFDDGERHEATAVLTSMLDLDAPSADDAQSANKRSVPIAIEPLPLLQDMPAIPAMGRLLLGGEFVTQRPLLTNDQQATLRQKFQTLLKDIGRKIRGKSEFSERVHLVMQTLYARQLHAYGAAQALMISYLGTPPGPGNCVASTKLVVAVFSELGITEADGWTLGVQKYLDHIQPVFYHAADGLIWNLMAGSLSAEIDAPIYRPEFLLDGFVRGRGMESPLSAEALRLAVPNVPPGTGDPTTSSTNSNLDFAPGTGVGVYRDGPAPSATTLQSPYEGDAREMAARLKNQIAAQQPLSRALEAYRRNRNDPAACYDVAAAYEELHQFTQALTYARKVEQLQPENRNSKVIILEALYKMERYDEALQLATRYTNTIGDPGAAKVYQYVMQRVLTKIALQPGASADQLHRARDALEKFLSTWPDGVKYITQDGESQWWIDRGQKRHLIASLTKVEKRLAAMSQPK